MWRATPELVRTLRQRYEDTDQHISSIAAEFGLGERTLSRMAKTEGWTRRSDRLRGLPKAVQLLEQAEALAAGRALDNPIRHPEVRAISAFTRVSDALWRASKGDGPDELPTHGPHPSRLGAARLAPQDDGAKEDTRAPQADGAKAAPPTPYPSPPLATLVEGGEQQTSTIDRLEALVVEQIAIAEQARAQVTDKRQLAKASDKNARTLATLTQTLRALQQMRTGKPLEPEMTHDDDDMPRDLDEFRRDLARRIDAFVASRTDAADADGNSAAPLAVDG